ncbi:MAG TPA: hypothetical protein VK735_23030 [Pseudonocardia sp.]|uniref:hypothetical protein n=1 Tax=Pseudonocardia sp. TaxID=60912 RepID=UPI002C9F5891|nr:hypothetical protein [Pseudonocardia sp.]HTF50323.1 hypothetical protein [Pseudonocardia sp.]
MRRPGTRMGASMRVWGAIVVGIICVLIGGLWFLQGVGVVGGSFMTGSKLWLFIGVVVVLAGIALLRTGFRARRRGATGNQS